jgi:hypothetical protein
VRLAEIERVTFGGPVMREKSRSPRLAGDGLEIGTDGVRRELLRTGPYQKLMQVTQEHYIAGYIAAG